MSNGKGDRVSANGAAKTCFLLLEPRGFCNSGETAKRIARCRGVKEVHLMSGRYGFVVSANASTAKDLDHISSAVRKASGSRSVKIAVSHFIYR
jgi:DNA-binding Lrp family transcriptional regulator